MQHYTFHDGSAPSTTQTQVLVDGTHYCTYQVGFGYLDLDGFGVGTPEIKVFHDTLTPSVTLTQVTLDGSHNGSFQSGQGYWRLWGYANDQGVIGKFLGSTLSFIGYPIRKLNSTFIVLLESVLGSIGRIFNRTSKILPQSSLSTPGLSFRSDFFANPSTIQTLRVFFSSLINLTGSSSNRGRPILTAILSFIGTFPRPVKSKTLAAALNFVGAFTKRTLKLINDVVSFTTSFVNRGKLFAANLFLSGTVTRTRGKIFTPVLSFVGVIKKFSPRTLPSTLSFVGRIFHSIPTFTSTLTATLSFSGFFAAGRKFFKSNTAALSFVGAITRFSKKGLTAALSFVGAFTKRGSKLITAVLSFVGTLTSSAPLQLLMMGTLSFVGNIRTHQGKRFVAFLSFSGNVINSISKSIASALSFSGLMVKQFPRLLTAALSFVGTFITIRPIVVALSGALSFVGNFIAQRGRIFAATLSFSGKITRSITRSFVATLSFVGNFIRSRPALFTGALSFSGIVGGIKGKAQVFAATLSFTGVSIRRMVTNLASTLSFIGDLPHRPSQVFQKLITTLLRLQSSLVPATWIALFRTVIVTSANKFLQNIIGMTIHENKCLTHTEFQQTLTTTPVALNLNGSGPYKTLFIKNLSTLNSVQIDVSTSFDQFPQLIRPLMGVYMSPGTAVVVYGRSSSGSADIQVLAGN